MGQSIVALYFYSDGNSSTFDLTITDQPTVPCLHLEKIWKNHLIVSRKSDCEEGQNPPDCEGGHDEHLDDNDCRIEGKSLKQLLVHVQSHPFKSLQKVD